MTAIYRVVTILGRKSAQFAARLVHAGALSPLVRQAYKGRTPWVAGLRASAGAGATAAQLQAAAFECFDTSARSVPQVSTQS